MKTLNKWAAMALAIGMATSFISCDKDDDNTVDPPTNNDPLSSYVVAGEESTSTADVKLYFGEDPYAGYNTVAVRLMEPGTDNIIENATVSFMPMMDMGTMMHSTPFSDPEFDVDMDAYVGSSTFIMPSDMGNWTFSVMVEQSGKVMDTATFTIDVKAKQEARLFNFKSALNNDTYFVALKEPMSPEIGMNDFEVMVYKRETMMSFPPATDLKIEIEPEMPSMGHGSPNNEHPTHIADGLYRGKVNFTMSGYWKVNMKIMNAQDSVIKADGFFDITFQ